MLPLSIDNVVGNAVEQSHFGGHGLKEFFLKKFHFLFNGLPNLRNYLHADAKDTYQDLLTDRYEQNYSLPYILVASNVLRMKFLPILLIGFVVFPLGLSAQNQKNQIQVERMQISWEHQGDQITFTATAPDDGWVALGFNTENNIVGSNLIIIGVNGDNVQAEDFYVVSAGNPKPIKSLGAKSQIKNYKGWEKQGKTTIAFSLPVKSNDDYHLDLKEGSKVWLICAYSMEDDFGHHSRMRRHIEITL